MDNPTVAQVKAFAKERGVRGYYHRVKAEVIKRLGSGKISRTKK